MEPSLIIQPDIKAYIVSLMREQNFQDFSIITRSNKRLPTHRLILARLPFFAQYFQQNRESHELRVDSEVFAVLILLDLLYKDQFTIPDYITAPDFIDLVNLVEAWKLPISYRHKLSSTLTALVPKC